MLDGDRAAAAEVEIHGRLFATKRVDFADLEPATSDADDADGDEGNGGRAGWYRLLASGADILPGASHNPGAQAFVEELRDASVELEHIADRLDQAEKAGDTAEAERIRDEAEAHIQDNLPIAPTLALAAVMAAVTDDLDARRDLQAGIEDVRQAISMGSVDDVKLAFASLNEVMSRVQLPDHELPGADANLLAKYRQ